MLHLQNPTHFVCEAKRFSSFCLAQLDTYSSQSPLSQGFCFAKGLI